MKFCVGVLALCLLGVVSSSSIAAENWKRGTSESVLVKQGAVRLSATQVRSLITGNTEKWRYGGGSDACYYAAEGKLTCKKSGKITVENWSVKSDGRVCYRNCHYYLRLKSELVAVRNGSVIGVVRFVGGNRL